MEPVVMMLEDIFKEHGQTVFGALSGEQGLELFQNNRIDLVISDLGMPGMNGWEVGERVKAACEERGVPKIPFIMFTGWGGQVAESDRLEKSGVDAVVEKPIDVAKMMRVIKEVVQKGEESLE
jgi:CheY-like chemotaxis protein